MKPCNKNIVEVLELVEWMIELATRGDIDREDLSCGILYGIILDSAYKIKQLAEEEKISHIRKGIWSDMNQSI